MINEIINQIEKQLHAEFGDKIYSKERIKQNERN